MLIQLVDRSQDMCDAWTTEFMYCDDVIIYCDDFFSPETDCIVSPANSFGFMSGGLDGVITKVLGPQIEKKVQDRIANTSIKELLVGDAIIVETDNEKIPYCISAPTMRVSMAIDNTVNVYLASKAIFSLLLSNPQIKIVTISGLGTGVGQMPYEVCAKQMKQAYKEVWLNEGVPTESLYYEVKKQNYLTV